MGETHYALGDTAMWLITLGGLLALGLVTDLVGRHTRRPRVTLLIVFDFSMSRLNTQGQFAPGVASVSR